MIVTATRRPHGGHLLKYEGVQMLTTRPWSKVPIEDKFRYGERLSALNAAQVERDRARTHAAGVAAQMRALEEGRA